ncbi:MAG: type II toxin-antitoxin system Phd/YefM family antitoxin [Atopobiaceae bacterium]|nr:type II toxin-antitoxin system Phd/YefM family antitoxin [Atopobiaceae bacterium]
MMTIPMSDLKNTSAVSTLCRESDEPVLVTKHGRPDFWLVRPDEMERLRQAEARDQLYQSIDHSERQWRDGLATEALEGIARVRARHGL